jgi:hypothetical protein
MVRRFPVLMWLVLLASLVTARSLPACTTALLDSVSMGPYSVWNLAYESRKGRIHYRTAGRPRVKRIDLARIDFSCGAGARFVDIDAERWGDVTTSLHPYDPEANLRLVRQSFGKSRVPIPAGAENAVATFPDRFRCAGTAP